MRFTRAFSVVLILLLAAVAASAAPNFSGDWKLNVANSSFGEMPPPDSMTQKVSHQEPNLKVAVKQSSEMGEFDYEANYTTDGKESVNKMRENPSTSIVKWEGDALTFETKGKFGDADFTMKDKWTLSADGKVLTMERHFSSEYGEGDQKLVLEKQ